MYWLSGWAGTGKSTISRTIARKYSDRCELGATFFFSRGRGDARHARAFFTTLAYQLSERSPDLRKLIIQAVSKNSAIKTKPLDDQCNELILGPLSMLDYGESTKLSHLFVIDALDECDSEDDIRKILQLLGKAKSLQNVRLRIFLTSRPELSLREEINELSRHQPVHNFILHDISPQTVDMDISKFLEYALGLVAKRLSIGPDWPGTWEIETLTMKACGLFIWASTAYLFIGAVKRRRFARDRLDMLLNNSNIPISGGDEPNTPEKSLDAIYIAVLQQSIHHGCLQMEKDVIISLLKLVLGSLVVLFSQLSPYSLSKLLRIPANEIDETLEELHAIIKVPKIPKDPIRLHHPSFRDFLLTKERCEAFWVDEKLAHQQLASYCIEMMLSSLDRDDICGLRDPGSLAADIEREKVDDCLPPEVQYACLYWVQHLQKGEYRLEDNGKVHGFLKTHFLRWLEALSLIGKMREGVYAVIALESLALKAVSNLA